MERGFNTQKSQFCVMPCQNTQLTSKWPTSPWRSRLKMFCDRNCASTHPALQGRVAPQALWKLGSLLSSKATNDARGARIHRPLLFRFFRYMLGPSDRNFCAKGSVTLLFEDITTPEANYMQQLHATTKLSAAVSWIIVRSTWARHDATHLGHELFLHLGLVFVFFLPPSPQNKYRAWHSSSGTTLGLSAAAELRSFHL